MPVPIVLVVLASAAMAVEPAHLPGELSADAVLDGAYPYPPSPAFTVVERTDGLAVERLGTVPAPGIHPRILFSPDQLPELRARIQRTATGQALMRQLQRRILALRDAKAWESRYFEALVAGGGPTALAILDANHRKPTEPPGHYQPQPLYSLTLECLAALLADDRDRGIRAGKAVAGYAAMIAPLVERAVAVPMSDDVARCRVEPSADGTWSGQQSLRDLMGEQLLGYAYDFAACWMEEGDRATVRRVIARATAGRIWLGARLPHHFRNWNWCATAMAQPLLALAIEGEEGFDSRVPALGAQVARDYLTYGISPSGASTEAVGYTQFGFVWANPFIWAMDRRGDHLLRHGHFREMLTWYAHTADPTRNLWLSSGDGGDGGPSLGTALLWKHVLPADPLADANLRRVLDALGDKIASARDHIIEQLVLCEDPEKTSAFPTGLPTTWFDPLRSSLIARDGWTPDAAVLHFECRTDSVGSSHEHADRGHFTFTALGRTWATDYFRSVESRHHSVVLIDGKGQGYYPGPGRWLGLVDTPEVTIAACDQLDAYRWTWPKQILSESPGNPRFSFTRWASYRDEAAAYRARLGTRVPERDDRPSVVAHWQGFVDVAGGPRMWDEDSWPVRLPWNPLQKAFRTVVFAKGDQPWLLVVDDIAKDAQERLYEWGMVTGPDTGLLSLDGETAELCDVSVPRNAEGRLQPLADAALLKVSVLRRNAPALAEDYTAMPSIRLEQYERRDSLMPPGPTAKLSGNRSYGTDRRLIVPSRSADPGFVVLLQPHRRGTAPAAVAWNDDRTAITIGSGSGATVVRLLPGADGRTRISTVSGGRTTALP